MKEIQLKIRGDGPRKRTKEAAGRNTPPRTTTFHDVDDLHVGTIMEFVDDSGKGHGFCNWYTAADSDVTGDYAEAERQMRAAICR